MDWPQILSIVGTVLLMVAVFVGAYYASKIVGKNYKSRSICSGNMSVLEICNVGKDRSLLIVRAANKTLLVGSTPHEFTLLGELDPEDLKESSECALEKKDFSSIFSSVIKSKGKKFGEGDHK